MSTTIPLPWVTPPTSANRSLRSVSPYVRAAAVRTMREEAAAAIAAADIPEWTGQASVTLHYRPGTRRRCDADGMFPVLKACLDELVVAGVLADDSRVEVPRAACEIHAPASDAEMWLTLEPVA